MKHIKDFKPFFESRQTEKQALKYLTDESNLDTLKEIDKSKNQILIPSMAYFISKDVELNRIEQTFIKIPRLLDRKLININLTKRGVKLDDKFYTNWLEFSEKIDGLDLGVNYKDNKKNQKEFVNDDLDKPIWSGNDIRIFDANDVGKCIKLGKGKEFCISQPGNAMYQSYRDSKNSSFYFIYDDNQKDNPLNVVVFDNSAFGIELTDERNVTGNIYKYGNDSDGYIEYLKSKGVPVDKMVNLPKSKKEEKDNKLLGTVIKDTKKFIELSPDYKSKYIGRRYILTDKQFNYLIDNKLNSLIIEYLNVGNILTIPQFKKIEETSSFLKTYIRTSYLMLKNNQSYRPEIKELKYLKKFGYLDRDMEYANGQNNKEYLYTLNPKNGNIKLSDISLSFAVKGGYYRLCKKVIESREISLTELNKELTISSKNGYTKIVKLLLDNGATVNYNNGIPLIEAVERGHIEVAKVLIEYGANLDVTYNTPLGSAIREGHPEIATLLLNNGAEVPTDSSKAILIRLVCTYGYIDVLKIFIERGMDITIQDNIPIKIASKGGHTEIVKLLKKHGATLE